MLLARAKVVVVVPVVLEVVGEAKLNVVQAVGVMSNSIVIVRAHVR